METKIERLTKEQEALIPVFIEKYKNIGLSTNRCDRARVENLIPKIYKLVEQKPPTKIQWWDSPLKAIKELKLVSIDSVFYPQYHLSWIAFYDYLLSIGVKISDDLLEKFNLLKEYSKEGSILIPLEDTCHAIDRPIAIHLDDRGRLHKLGAYAMEFNDGEGMCSIRGVRVPEKYGLVPVEDWDSKWILEEQNTEIRSVLLDYIPKEKLLESLDGKIIDTWKDYELIKIDNLERQPTILLKMVCPSTGRIYVEGIPPYITTCKDALKWQYHGLDPESFVMET